MQVNNGFGWIFDTVASDYDKYRPGYPAKLYDAIFNYASLGPSSQILEIGIGAGQATQPILEKGGTLTAIEPGKGFCDLCQEKFRAVDSFSVINTTFEDAVLPQAQFDLIFSATAFHWVPEEIGYPKVFSLLKAGGVFARFANRPFRDLGNPALAEEIDDLYDLYYNRYHGKKKTKLKEFDLRQAAEIANIAARYGFEDIEYRLFKRERVFTAKEYTALLGTYSDHIAIEEKIRREFFEKIEAAIKRHGGKLTIYDTIDLELARKI